MRLGFMPKKPAKRVRKRQLKQPLSLTVAFGIQIEKVAAAVGRFYLET